MDPSASEIWVVGPPEFNFSVHGWRLAYDMQFTFKREAVCIAVFLLLPLFLGLLFAVLVPLLLRSL